jgi:hypothetical protein
MSIQTLKDQLIDQLRNEKVKVRSKCIRIPLANMCRMLMNESEISICEPYCGSTALSINVIEMLKSMDYHRKINIYLNDASEQITTLTLLLYTNMNRISIEFSTMDPDEFISQMSVKNCHVMLYDPPYLHKHIGYGHQRYSIQKYCEDVIYIRSYFKYYFICNNWISQFFYVTREMVENRGGVQYIINAEAEERSSSELEICYFTPTLWPFR